ncbi:MAG: aminotransferase class V-fold PLP-dependent enzyme [Bacteroidota bacterium]
MIQTGLDIQRIRQATPAVETLRDFNAAGSSLPTKATVEAVIKYLREEALQGGYTYYERKRDELDQIYQHAAQLINAKPSEISIVENATVAFVKALFGIDWQPGDVILTSEIEYGNNFLNFLKLKQEKGVEIRVAPSDELGDVDVQRFENYIDDKVKLIAVTHIPTNSGAIAPVATIGKIARMHDILYLVDACQSIGHIPFDVQEIGCDFASATSRKYLRGPRGLGFLYVSERVLMKMQPTYFEMLTTEWIDEERYQLSRSNIMFENFERPMAMIAGFSNALAEANELGIINTWPRIKLLADYLRERLVQVQDVVLHDIGKQQCGIVSFRKTGVDANALKNHLDEFDINTSVSPRFCTALDMNKRGLDNVNRASLHYYNTKEEIDFLIDKIDAI